MNLLKLSLSHSMNPTIKYEILLALCFFSFCPNRMGFSYMQVNCNLNENIYTYKMITKILIVQLSAFEVDDLREMNSFFVGGKSVYLLNVQFIILK